MVNLLAFLNAVDPTVLIIAIVLIFILQSPVLTFPGYLIMVISGLHFGAFHGGLINYLGLISSAVIGYLLGRWTSIDLQTEDSNKYLKKFSRFVDRHGMNSVILLRILPLAPYNVVSFGSGFSKLDFKKYLINSGVPLIGWSFFWSYIGSAYAMRYVEKVDLNLGMYHLVSLIVFLMIVGLLKYLQIRRK